MCVPAAWEGGAGPWLAGRRSVARSQAWGMPHQAAREAAGRPRGAPTATRSPCCVAGRAAGDLPTTWLAAALPPPLLGREGCSPARSTLLVRRRGGAARARGCRGRGRLFASARGPPAWRGMHRVCVPASMGAKSRGPTHPWPRNVTSADVRIERCARSRRRGPPMRGRPPLLPPPPAAGFRVEGLATTWLAAALPPPCWAWRAAARPDRPC